MEKSYTVKDFLEVKAAREPSFSPDGTNIAYLGTESGTSQVWMVSTLGGISEQLTDFPDGISVAIFSPTSNSLIFGKAAGGNEQTQLFLLDVETRDITPLTDRPDIRHDFGSWTYDGTQICFSSNERNGVDFDVYVMDIATKEKRCVYDRGGWCQAAGFSPSGSYLLVRADHSNLDTDTYLCDLKNGDIRHITPHSGTAMQTNLSWLPDESGFLFVMDQDRDFTALARYDLNSHSFKYVLTPAWDIENAIIDKKGTTVAVVINEDGYTKAFLYDLATFEMVACEFPNGNIAELCFSEDSSMLAYALGDSRRTVDVWVLDVEKKKSHQVTKSHQGVPPEILVEPTLVRYKSFDGLSIPAFVYMPKHVPEGGKVPAIIHMHGGPEGQYLPTYAPFMQYLLYSGYAVIAPNVRGSSGYGKAYLALDDVEKRMDSVKDMAALHGYAETIEGIAVDKLVLYGGSYGGFMVLAGLAFYPELWAAGVDTVGIANFVTFLENTAPYRRALREVEYGSLENDRAFLEKISPIHSVEHITAPLFVIHGANDPRVPLSEAEQIVSRLKERGREVEFLVYPDEGHGLAKLQNRLDAYPKVHAFLQKVLQ